MPKVKLNLPSSSSPGPGTGNMRDAILAFSAGGRDFMSMAESFRKNRISDATNAALSQSVAGDGQFDEQDLANASSNSSVDMSSFLDTYNKGRESQSTLAAQEISNRLTGAQADKAEYEMSDDYLEQVRKEREARIDRDRASIEASGSARDLNRYNLGLAQAQEKGLKDFGSVLQTARTDSDQSVMDAFNSGMTKLQRKAEANGTTVNPADVRLLTESRDRSLDDGRTKAILEATQAFIATNPQVDISKTPAGQIFNQAMTSSQRVRDKVLEADLTDRKNQRTAFEQAVNPVSMVKMGKGNKPQILTNSKAISANYIDPNKLNAVSEFAQEFGLDPEESSASVTDYLGDNSSYDHRTNAEGMRDVLIAADGNRDIVERVLSKEMARDNEWLSWAGDKEELYVKNWDAAVKEAEREASEFRGWAEQELELRSPKKAGDIFDIVSGLSAQERDANTPPPPPPPPATTPAEAANSVTSSPWRDYVNGKPRI